MLLFLRFYFYLLMICGGTFSVGYIVFAALNIYQRIPNFFAKVFFCMLTGSVIIVFILSVICTRGKTISLAFIPLFIALFLEYGKSGLKAGFKKISFSEREPAVNWMLILAGSLFIFGYYFILFYRGGQFPFVMPKRDTIYYGSISYYILHTGQENVFHILNNFSSQYRGVSPYHYFELWFNAFCAEIFHVNFSQCLTFLVYPFFIFCCFLGICALVKLVVRKNYPYYFIAPFVFLFTGGIDFSLYSRLPFLSNIKLEGFTDYIIDFTSLKAAVIYCFFAAFTILFYIRAYRIAFIALLFLPVCSIALLPSIVGGVLIYSIFSGRQMRLTIKKEFSTPLLCIILLITILSFYSILPNPEASETAINFRNSFSNTIFLFNWIGFKNAAAILIAYSLIFILFYIPYFLLSAQAIISDDRIRKLFMILASVSFAGVIAASFNFSEINSPQLFALSANCFATVFIILLIVWQIENGKSFLLKIFVCLLPVLSVVFSILQQKQFYKLLVTSPDQGYLNKIQTTIERNHLRKGISIRSPEEYIPAAREFNFPEYVNGMYIPFNFHSELMPVSLSDFNANPNSPNIYVRHILHQLTESGIFYRFVHQEISNHEFKNIDQSQLDFLDEYHIDYGVISARATISPLLQARVLELFEDPVTHERFAVFKN